MRKLIFIFLLFVLPAFGQGFRIGDNAPITSSLTTPGQISTVTSAIINICASPANAVPCTNKATTFTSVTLGTPCSTSTQVVLSGTNSCIGTTDIRGNWGAWVAAGNYDWTVTVSTGQSFGPFTVSVGFPAGSSISPGTINGPTTYTGNNTHSGIETFNGPLNSTAGGSLVQSSINKVIYVDQQAGATADVKFANACAALPAGGGVLDARGFGATTQTFAATVSCGSKTKIVTFLFDPSTLFRASTAALNMVQYEPANVIRGFTFDCTNLGTTYSGNVLQNDQSVDYSNATKTTLEDITIGSEAAAGSSCAGTATGTGIVLKSVGPSNVGVEFLSIRHVRQDGLFNGILLEASGGSLNGFTSGNNIHDVIIMDAQHGFHFNSHGGPIEGNICSDCVFEKSANGGDAVFMESDGSTFSKIYRNLFYGVSWDTTTWATLTAPVGTVMYDNTFEGKFAGVCSGNCPGNLGQADYNTLHNTHFADTSAAFFWGSFGGAWLSSHTGNGLRFNAVDISKVFHFYPITSGNSCMQLDAVSIGTAGQFCGSGAGIISAGVGTGVFNGGGAQNNGGAVLNFPTVGANFVSDTATQTLTNKTLTTPTLSGITNATGLQLFNTTTTCTTAATINTPCTTAAITLPVAYADTNYRLSCQGLGPTQFPQLQAVTKSNTTFTITLNNLTAAAASYTSFDCSAVHN